MYDTGILAYALIAMGLLLLVAEIFLPTGGVLFVLSVSAIVVGVAMTFSINTSTGLATLISVFIAMPVLLIVGYHYLPRTPFGRKFILSAPQEDETIATMPVNVELEQLRGRYGRTVSALRPAGVTEFDGRRIDTMSEGIMIEPGQWVRCIDVKAGKVIVRPVDRPPDLGDLETTDFS